MQQDILTKKSTHTHKKQPFGTLAGLSQNDKLDFIAFNINSKKALNINQILAKQQS